MYRASVGRLVLPSSDTVKHEDVAKMIVITIVLEHKAVELKNIYRGTWIKLSEYRKMN